MNGRELGTKNSKVCNGGVGNRIYRELPNRSYRLLSLNYHIACNYQRSLATFPPRKDIGVISQQVQNSAHNEIDVIFQSLGFVVKGW